MLLEFWISLEVQAWFLSSSTLSSWPTPVLTRVLLPMYKLSKLTQIILIGFLTYFLKSSHYFMCVCTKLDTCRKSSPPGNEFFKIHWHAVLCWDMQDHLTLYPVNCDNLLLRGLWEMDSGSSSLLFGKCFLKILVNSGSGGTIAGQDISIQFWKLG